MATPAAAPFMAPAAMAAFGPLEGLLQTVNTSPYFIGLMMLTMNLGARFLSLEITKGQEQFLSHPLVRRFLIFVIFFMATRNVWVAFWMSIIMILIIGYLFNENSSLCLFRGGLPGSSCSIAQAEGFVASSTQPSASAPATQQQQGLSPEENNILQMLLAKQSRLTASAPKGTEETHPSALYSMYKTNVEKIKQLF
jgi:hypothetical protein